ncbi:MAG TPA: extracellular solute-binding protein [Baekduia sp.]|uniref:extracellular solute-binding protein n=1 Tax=Baekduia sp. TaxID=2600305 RepID=UPI002BC60587|nr:extracellular solute-binding protein [Baekduia sp.]HMJ37801.1 extracellular solute-binding protein [Baekduia sp.]
MKLSRMFAPLVVAGATALAVGCGGTPGGSSDNAKTQTTASAKPDVAKAGNVTLTVWDQEVRGGQAAQIKRLNGEFMAKYPNVKIKRVAKSFEDVNTTLKLAVSGPKAPDVVQANQGLGVMGQLVKAKLIRPVDDYAKIYGWADRYPSLLLDLNKFEPTGTTFGAGSLYGLSQMGEIVGVFYNKKKVTAVPKTLAEFEQQVADAKAQGDVPVQFGNLDKWPGIHEYETLLGQTADKQAVRDFVFQKSGASFDTPAFTEAATKLQGWAKSGNFTPDFNGVGYDPAWKRFSGGKGRFLIAGTWLVADLSKRMGDNVGFFLMPGADAGADPVALGGESLPFTITSKAKNPDVAAAYIDFLTDANAQKALSETDNLPAMKSDAPSATTGLLGEVATAWTTLGKADGLIPYLDYTTTTFYDDISAAIQKLLAGKTSPEDFSKSVQGSVSSAKASS